MENLMKAYKRLLKVAIVGAPNAGKSTLLNRLVNNEISCVSNKVHTTRQNVLGVHTQDDIQLEFFDSPGIITRQHVLKHRLEDSLLIGPKLAAKRCDIIAVVVDAGNIRERKRLNKGLLELLHQHSDKESLLILNKVDLIKDKRQLLDITTRLTQGCIAGKCKLNKKDLTRMSYEELKNLNLIGNLGLKETEPPKENKYKHVIELQKSKNDTAEVCSNDSKWKHYVGISDTFEDPNQIGYANFSDVFSISAYNDDGVDELRQHMLGLAKPVEEWPHGPDYLTNQTTRDIAHGILRGKVMDYAVHASPYLIKFKYLRYVIGQLIGERGVNIFRIIEDSRDLISKTLGCDVKLNILVESKDRK